MATKKKITKKATTNETVAKNAENTKNTAAKKTTSKKVATKKTPPKSKAVNNTVVKKKTAKKVASNNPENPDNLIHGIEPYVEKANEKYMNPKQVEHFKNILLAWKQNLLDEVSKTIHLMQDENINHPDPNDRASQETDMSLELRNRDRERKLLKKIDSTVLRVDTDDYGWCDRCGIEIGIRRLEARPTAELCVDCKTLNEIKERQMI